MSSLSCVPVFKRKWLSSETLQRQQNEGKDLAQYCVAYLRKDLKDDSGIEKETQQVFWAIVDFGVCWYFKYGIQNIWLAPQQWVWLLQHTMPNDAKMQCEENRCAKNSFQSGDCVCDVTYVHADMYLF